MAAMRKHPDAQAADFDRLLSFTIPDRNARGRVVRLGPVLGKILSAHDYAPAIKRLLAEALALTALLGGLLKRQGSQLTLQAQTDGGVVELMVCDYRDGELRGYVKHDAEQAAALGDNPSLAELFGKGHLAVTFDIAGGGNQYQGIVPLEGKSLTQAVENYFEQSEQVPTLIRTAVEAGDAECVAGGLLVQHLAETEDGRDRLHDLPRRRSACRRSARSHPRRASRADRWFPLLGPDAAASRSARGLHSRTALSGIAPRRAVAVRTAGSRR